jgi:hypothetical protein
MIVVTERYREGYSRTYIDYLRMVAEVPRPLIACE